MNYHIFKRTALHNQCRECINRSYGLNLKRKDCQYWIYPETCRTCERVSNIVIDIAPLSRWKIRLAAGKQKHSKKEKEQ